MGTYQTSFTVPNLVKEVKRIPISSVVLGGQRVPLGDALYSVDQKISAEAVDPLVFEGQKLIPSVTRVFSKSRDLYVLLQAYQRGATTTQPLVAFVTFYRGDVKTFETPPLAVTSGLNMKSKAVPLRFTNATPPFTWKERGDVGGSRKKDSFPAPKKSEASVVWLVPSKAKRRLLGT